MTAKAASVGEKISEFVLPRSSLTYTQEEAAKFLGRDIKLGLTNAENAASRLNKKYGLGFKNLDEVDNFLKTFQRNNTEINMSDLADEIKRPIIQATPLRNFDNIFFKGLTPEEAELSLDLLTKNAIKRVATSSKRQPIVIEKVENVTKDLVKGHARWLKQTDSFVDTLGKTLTPNSFWRNTDDILGDPATLVPYVNVNIEKGLIPRDLTVTHELGHVFKKHKYFEGYERVDLLTRRLVDENKNPVLFSKIGNSIQEIEAEVTAIRYAKKLGIETDSLQQGKSLKLIDFIEIIKTQLKEGGVGYGEIISFIDELTRIVPEARRPNSIVTNIYNTISSPVDRVVAKLNRENPTFVRNIKTRKINDMSEAEAYAVYLREKLWSEGVSYSQLEDELPKLIQALTKK